MDKKTNHSKSDADKKELSSGRNHITRKNTKK